MPLLATAAVLLAATLAPPGAVVAREPTEAPVALVDEAQVRDLCAALSRWAPPDSDTDDPASLAAARREREDKAEKAAAATYRVEVPARGFRIGRYRAGQKELELDGDYPLRAIDDHLALDLAGIDEVAFEATPEQVARWTRAKKADGLRLIVVFRPNADRCAGNAQARSWRLSGVPVSWTLLEGESPAAVADESGQPVRMQGAEAAAKPPRPRTVLVEKVSLDGSEGRAKLEGVQAALDKCAGGAERSGALVVIFAVEGGRVRDPQVVVDAARDEATSQCVAQALSGAQLSGAGAGSGRGTATLALQ